MERPKPNPASSATVEYPTGDGRPMAETDTHRDAMTDAIETLKRFFADDPGVYVSGNNFVYYTEGDPRRVVSPDAYVVKGVAKRRRDTFKVWEEGGRVPCFVLEVTSKSTRREDQRDKLGRYRDALGVREYFLFDPYGEWISERLRGYRLRAGAYQTVRPQRDTGRLRSLQLGLELEVVDDRLRFFRPGAAEPLPTPEERAEQEKGRAERAEAELERLWAELERRGREPPPQAEPDE